MPVGFGGFRKRRDKTEGNDNYEKAKDQYGDDCRDSVRINECGADGTVVRMVVPIAVAVE